MGRVSTIAESPNRSVVYSMLSSQEFRIYLGGPALTTPQSAARFWFRTPGPALNSKASETLWQFELR